MIEERGEEGNKDCERSIVNSEGVREAMRRKEVQREEEKNRDFEEKTTKRPWRRKRETIMAS